MPHLKVAEPSYLKMRLIPRLTNHSTRYSAAPSFVVPHSRTVMGTSCFSVCGPKLWNSLPIPLRTTNTLSSFRTGLKTYLFDLAYPP